MIGHDQLTKDLLEAFFDDLLRLTVPGIARHLDLGSIHFLRGQLFTDLPQGRERRLDLVAEVASAGGKPEIIVVHVEPEGKARSTMPARLWRYAMLLRQRHDKPVVSIVVYRTGGKAGIHKRTIREKIWGQELASFSYFSVGLSGSDAQEFLERPEPLAWALAALARSGPLTPAHHKMGCLRPIVEAPVDEARRFLLANFVETYIQLKGEDAEEYRALLAEEDNQEVATMELTWADKIEARGIERGLERGLEQGRQQGRQQGEAALLMRLMARKFGALGAKMRREIENADPQQLRDWGERFVTAQSIEEVFNGSR